VASLEKRNGAYRLVWREGGKKKSKPLGKITKREAEVERTRKEAEIHGLAVPAVSPLVPTFGEFLRGYLSWHEQEYPDSHWRIKLACEKHLAPRFGHLALNGITAERVEQFKVSRRKEVAVETVNKELRTLHAVVNRAVALGVITANPFRVVGQIKVVESEPHNFYTHDQLRLLYGVDPEHAPVWKLMVNTGMRRGEAMALKWCNVLSDRVRIVSTSQARTKSGKWRDVPLSPGASEALAQLCRSGEYVLPRMTGESLSRAFAKAAKRAGLCGSLHDLRHTFCSQLVMQGVALRTVQVLAGHSSFKTTEGYAHLAPGHLQESVKGLRL